MGGGLVRHGSEKLGATVKRANDCGKALGLP